MRGCLRYAAAHPLPELFFLVGSSSSASSSSSSSCVHKTQTRLGSWVQASFASRRGKKLRVCVSCGAHAIYQPLSLSREGERTSSCSWMYSSTQPLMLSFLSSSVPSSTPAHGKVSAMMFQDSEPRGPDVAAVEPLRRHNHQSCSFPRPHRRTAATASLEQRV